MPPTGSTAQRQAPPRESGPSYSARHPDLSGRLVYADPRSLPSYPTLGVKLDCTNAAALTASTSFKSPPPILDTSGPVNPASLKAATAAAAASAALQSSQPPPALSPQQQQQQRQQQRMAAQFSPTRSTSPELPPSSPKAVGSTAGSSMAAANRAAASGRRPHHRKSSSTSAANLGAAAPAASATPARPSSSTLDWGNSAATQAFRNNQIAQANSASAPPEKPIPEIAALGHHPSLRAAKGAMKTAASGGGSTSNASSVPTLRTRAASNPLGSRYQKSLSALYPDSAAPAGTTTAAAAARPTANALSAATIAHGGKAPSVAGDRSSYVSEVGAVPYTTMNRQLFTSNPQIGPEAEDQNRTDVLHASAIAMAKRMYNPKVDGVTSGPGSGNARGTNLQEAAYKLAQERLEKLHEKYQKDREYREHYVDPNMGVGAGAGAGAGAGSADPAGRFSIRGRLRRRRSSSDSEVTENRRQSMEIRNQMSVLSNRISQVDQDKRRKDRQSVLLAAQRNVKSQLDNIDEQVYSNSGRVPPSLLASWEGKAHAAAQARADAHMSMYPRSDQVDIGGGKFMARADVDKIAARRVQPVIDDINERAQKEHERQEAIRKEQDERRTEAEVLKARDKEMKDMYRKMKQEQKEKDKAQKAQDKARKAEEKAAKKQGRALAQDDSVAAEGNEEDYMTAADTSGAEPELDDTSDAGEGSSRATHPAHRKLTNGRTSAAASHEAVSPHDEPTSPAALPIAAAPVSAPTATATNGDVGSDVGPSRRLSKLFVKTPKESARKKSEGNVIETKGKAILVSALGAAGATGSAGASGTGVGQRSSANGLGSPTHTASDKASTPLSPLSPVSDSESPSSPSKVKTWLKSRFSRPRTKSSASGTSAPGPSAATGPTAAASGVPGAGSAAAATNGQASAAEPPLQQHQPDTEKSFVGGHALTGAENAGPKEGAGAASSPSPAMGSGNLSLPLAGGALVGAVAATAATATTTTTTTKTTTAVAGDAGEGSGNQSAGPSGASLDTARGQATDSLLFRDVESPGAEDDASAKEQAGQQGAGDGAPVSGAAVPEPFTPGWNGRSFGLGPLAPVTMGPAKQESSSGAGAAGGADGIGAATAATDSRDDTLKAPSTDPTAPGNRASYASSSYSNSGHPGGSGGGVGGLPGVAGSGFGIVGANMFANITKTAQASDDASGAGGTFVSVLPPTAVPSSSAPSGESGVDASFTPPTAIRDPAQKKSASPVRDSRFLENLEEFV